MTEADEDAQAAEATVRPVRSRQSRLRSAVTSARRVQDQLDNRELRGARRLVRDLRTRAPEFVYLGDSALSFTSPSDTDGRRLWQMVSDDLSVGGRVTVVHGSSYHSALYQQYVRIVATSSTRPVVIFPLCLRVHTDPWWHHPKLAYTEATHLLDGVHADTPWWRIRASVKEPSPGAFAEHGQIEHRTWAGDRTVGEYLNPLRTRQGVSEDEWLRLLYAYHHGGAIQPDSPQVRSVTRLAATAREAGIPTVVYQTPVPVEHGTLLWGPGFRTLAEQNFAVLETAYLQGDPSAAVVQTGTTLGTEAFIDPRDGSEHMNETGRRWLSEQIGAAARQLA